MKRTLLTGLGAAALLLLVWGCKDETPPSEKPKIVHNNSVEYYVETSRLADGRIVIKTTQQIYVQSTPFRTIVKNDTLPTLGLETVRLEEAEKDTTIPKEYDIYFTLK